MDRRGSLRAGQVVTLRSPDFSTLDALQVAVDKDLISREFGGGISAHGQAYLLANGVGDKAELKVLRSTVMEIVWELVRRKDFPQLPSRCVSIFGCETIQDAEAFGVRYAGTGPIFEVLANRYYRLDMNWLEWASPVAQLWSRAYNYWSGTSSSKPFWEYVVPLPTKVGNRVK